MHIDTGRYYAAKVINKRLMAGREHMVRNEIAVLKKVSMGHQNILTLVDYFETMNNRIYCPAIRDILPLEPYSETNCLIVYLVTDLALGGELFDRICRKGSYYESDAADLIRAVLSAVADARRARADAGASRAKKPRLSADNAEEDSAEDDADALLLSDVKVIPWRAYGRLRDTPTAAREMTREPDELARVAASQSHVPEPQAEDEDDTVQVDVPAGLLSLLDISASPSKQRAHEEAELVHDLVRGVRRSAGEAVFGVGEVDEHGAVVDEDDDWEGEGLPWDAGEL